MFYFQNELSRASGQIYCHLFRFRAFIHPIISIEVTGEVFEDDQNPCLWVAITALHGNIVRCYALEDELKGEMKVEPSNSEQQQPELREENSSLDFVICSPAKHLKLVGHSDRVAASAWSPFTEDPETRLLVTASYDTSCIIWNVVEQQPLKRFYGHRSLIYSIRWSHFDPALIFTGGEDCFHCWNWTKQPDFDFRVFESLGKSLVKMKLLTDLHEPKELYSTMEFINASDQKEEKNAKILFPKKSYK